MFSFFKNKNLTPSAELEIDEFKNALLVSKKLTKKQINSLIKNLKKTYTGKTNLTYAHLKKAFSKDSNFPQSLDKQNELCKDLEIELRIANFRKKMIQDLENYNSLELCKGKITFNKPAEYCATMKKYQKKYDGKIINLKDFPIFPLYSCYNCKHCVGAVFIRPIIK